MTYAPDNGHASLRDTIVRGGFSAPGELSHWDERRDYRMDSGTGKGAGVELRIGRASLAAIQGRLLPEVHPASEVSAEEIPA